jgi:formylglycine-generating enzyme required for sulfatase activity
MAFVTPAFSCRINAFCVSLLVTVSFVPTLQAQTNEVGDILMQDIVGTEVSFELAFIPGGAFRLGSPEDEAGRDEDEGPRRTVSVEAFWMGITEVTHDAFAVFRDRRLDTDVGPTDDILFDADAVTRPSPPYEDPSQGMSGPGFPATGMTRLSALHFARWLSEKTGRLYRLPTEAEWELACRAGSERPHGLEEHEAVDDHAWYARNSGGAFHEAGSKEPNGWGIHDLLGNVAEWTLDPYDADFYSSIAEDGTASNPTTGPSARGRGVVRGGAFDDELTELRCADRFEETPEWKRRDPQMPKSRWWNTDAPHVGFRIVSPAAEYTAEEIRAYWETMLGTE